MEECNESTSQTSSTTTVHHTESQKGKAKIGIDTSNRLSCLSPTEDETQPLYEPLEHLSPNVCTDQASNRVQSTSPPVSCTHKTQQPNSTATKESSIHNSEDVLPNQDTELLSDSEEYSLANDILDEQQQFIKEIAQHIE